MEQILETFQRYDGMRSEIDELRVRDAAGMLVEMIEYEIGYGGSFSEITENKIVIVTRVMNKRDVMTYKPADPNDTAIFKKFLEIALIALECQKKMMDETTEQHKQMLDDVMSVTKGIPLFVKMGAGILMGGRLVNKLLAYLACFNDEELIKQLIELPRTDLKTLATGVLKNEFSKDDVKILIGSTDTTVAG